jgi:MraZ protein
MQTWFIGTFEHAIDRQRRVAVPRDWRAGPGEGMTLYVVCGPGRRLLAMTPEYFEREIVVRTQSVSFADAGRMAAISRIAGSARCTVVDRQGRIMLSEQLMNYARLENQAVLIGGFEIFHIVAPEAHDVDDDMEEAFAAFRDIHEADNLTHGGTP